MIPKLYMIPKNAANLRLIHLIPRQQGPESIYSGISGAYLTVWVIVGGRGAVETIYTTKC